jgi:hypothetical protein
VVLLAVVLAVPLTAAGAPAATPRVAPVVGNDFRISGTAALATEEGAVASWNAAAGAYLVVWEDYRDEATRTSEIYGRRVGPDGTPLAEDFRINDHSTAGRDEDPAVTATSTGWLVVWSRQQEGLQLLDIYAQRVSAAGGLVEGPFRVSGPAGLESETAPAVAWNGSESLVVWVDYRQYQTRGGDIYGRRVADDGTRPGADFRISGLNAVQDEQEPSVAWNGTDYLVVWEDFRDDGDGNSDVRGRRVTAAGEPAGRDSRISGTSATGDDKVPGVSSDGTGYLVVWEDWRLLPNRLSDIYGRLVSATGRPVGANFRVCGPGAVENDWTPVLAWDAAAQQYLVAWQDERDWAGRGSDIFGRRVAPDGARVGGDFRISGPAATTYEYSPAVAWGGGQHLVAWQDTREVPTRDRDIWGRRVDLDG